MSDQPAKKPRLAAAAEALIEAASLEADAMTQKQLVTNLDSLKASFDGNLNKVVQTMNSSTENFDAKINTLSQHVASVKSEVGALKALLEEDKKQKTLQMALTLTHLGSFEYFDSRSSKNSSDLAKTMIGWFLLGYGCGLPDGTIGESSYYDDESQKVAKKKAFRDKFTGQIKDLIRRQPRVVQKTDGKYEMYYK